MTYNIELSSKPDRTGRYSVMIRLHQKGRKPARVLTSVKIANGRAYWNQKKIWGKWIVRHVDRESLNQSILTEHDRIKNQTELYLKEQPAATPSMLAERFRSGTGDRYFDWMEQVLEDVKEQAYATYLGKKTIFNTLKSWAGNDLLMQNVTTALAIEFQAYLRKKPSRGGKLKGASVNKYMDQLHVLHKAILIKQGIPAKKADILSPWKDAEPLIELKPKKAKLPTNTVVEVAGLSVASTRRRVTPESAFVLWMISRLLAGIRFSDLLLLRYSSFTTDKDGQPVHLTYEMIKTGNVVSIPVLGEGRELLKRYWNPKAKPTDYVFPFLDNLQPYAGLLTHEQYKAASFPLKRKLYNTLTHWNNQINTCLKLLEKKAELPQPLRMHNARHSFAELARTIMQQDKSITIYDIQLMLGHSSYKTTEMYYEAGSGQDSSGAMKAVFGSQEKE